METPAKTDAVNEAELCLRDGSNALILGQIR